MQEKIFEVEQRIPILSSIPVIGDLFKFDSTDYSQENQIIFITPTILHAGRGGAEASDLFTRQYQIFQQTDFYYHKYLNDERAGARLRPKGEKRPVVTEAAIEGEGSTTTVEVYGVPPVDTKATQDEAGEQPASQEAPAESGFVPGSSEALPAEAELAPPVEPEKSTAPVEVPAVRPQDEQSAPPPSEESSSGARSGDQSRLSVILQQLSLGLARRENHGNQENVGQCRRT